MENNFIIIPSFLLNKLSENNIQLSARASCCLNNNSCGIHEGEECTTPCEKNPNQCYRCVSCDDCVSGCAGCVTCLSCVSCNICDNNCQVCDASCQPNCERCELCDTCQTKCQDTNGQVISSRIGSFRWINAPYLTKNRGDYIYNTDWNALLNYIENAYKEDDRSISFARVQKNFQFTHNMFNEVNNAINILTNANTGISSVSRDDEIYSRYFNIFRTEMNKASVRDTACRQNAIRPDCTDCEICVSGCQDCNASSCQGSCNSSSK